MTYTGLDFFSVHALPGSSFVGPIHILDALARAHPATGPADPTPLDRLLAMFRGVAFFCDNELDCPVRVPEFNDTFVTCGETATNYHILGIAGPRCTPHAGLDLDAQLVNGAVPRPLFIGVRPVIEDS